MVVRDDVLAWLRKLAEVYAEKKDYLTELDSAIGDADHGINMARGFLAVRDKLDGMAENDIGTILKSVGMTLVSTVGGASGPLYGTFFLKGAAVCTGKTELAAGDVAAMFEAGVQGVMLRGKAQPGEKTMLDALVPASAALQSAVEEGKDLKAAMERAAQAAEEGVAATIPMLATKGRASYLGERSRGFQDPGATSSFYLIQFAAAVWS